jgi:hypothetical protein
MVGVDGTRRELLPFFSSFDSFEARVSFFDEP